MCSHFTALFLAQQRASETWDGAGFRHPLFSSKCLFSLVAPQASVLPNVTYIYHYDCNGGAKLCIVINMLKAWWLEIFRGEKGVSGKYDSLHFSLCLYYRHTLLKPQCSIFALNVSVMDICT